MLAAPQDRTPETLDAWYREVLEHCTSQRIRFSTFHSDDTPIVIEGDFDTLVDMSAYKKRWILVNGVVHVLDDITSDIEIVGRAA